MLQPVTLAWGLLCLLTATAAEAQLQPLRSRRVTVATTPAEPLPEVRVAADVTTALVLDAPIDKHSLQWGDARVQVVDVGERSLIFRTITPPRDQDRWVLRVRYAGGADSEWAAFALVAHPTEVDTWVEAVRPQQSPASCKEQLAAAQARCEGARAEVWVLAERLGGHAVQVKPFRANKTEGWAYRLGDGLLLVVTPGPDAGPPWTPTTAVLRSQVLSKEKEVRVRAVHVRPGAPGKWGTVAVEAELPSPDAGPDFKLELRGGSGQSLTLHKVLIPPAQQKKEAGE